MDRVIFSKHRMTKIGHSLDQARTMFVVDLIGDTVTVFFTMCGHTEI